MKQSLQLKIGQHLAMTPQLQQAIRLLQLSTLELQTEIQEALESNLMLEAEDDNQAERQESNPQEAAQKEAKNNTEETSEPIESAAETLEFSEKEQQIPDELPVDSDWDDVFEPSYSAPSGSGQHEDSRDFTEYNSGDDKSLNAHLLDQLNLRTLSDRDRLITTTIIGSINDEGYLEESVEEILSGLNDRIDTPEELITIDEVEAMLRLIQQFEPTGVAARDLPESLLLQLATSEELPGLDHAKEIISKHFNLLASHDYNKLKKQLKVSDKQLHDAVSVIQLLKPRPCSQISDARTQYVVPDVFVSKLNGVWKVKLNPDIAPKLGINQQYSSLIKRADKSDDNTLLRSHLQDARWFIKSLHSRNETLLKVATSIIEKQRSFLGYGEEAMKPMVLRDIAEELEMHESTISRVTTQKFMHTPRGIFEFKYFFSSHVATADGGECSATAIRAMIKKLIAAENTQKPLSDSKIAESLVANGINVARRTIAKYREAMTIPPSTERKRLHI